MNKGLANKKYSKGDFTKSLLPLTRRRQFLDWLKIDFGLFIKIGLFLILFSLPLILTIALKNNFVSSFESTADANQKLVYIIEEFIFNIVETVSLVFLCVGLSGLSNVLKLMSWNEPTMFKYDFAAGIKSNFKQNILIFLLIGLIYSVIILCCNFIGLVSGSFTLYVILNGLLLGTFVFLFIPVFFVMISSNSYYENTFRHNFKNSFIIVVRHYFPIILSSVVVIGLALLSLIGNIYIYLIVTVLITTLILPVAIFAWRLYALSTFDKHINAQFPEYLCKGLKK